MPLPTADELEQGALVDGRGCLRLRSPAARTSASSSRSIVKGVNSNLQLKKRLDLPATANFLLRGIRGVAGEAREVWGLAATAGVPGFFALLLIADAIGVLSLSPSLVAGGGAVLHSSLGLGAERVSLAAAVEGLAWTWIVCGKT